MRNFLLLLPLISILPLLARSEASQGNKFSECTHTSYQCGAYGAHYDISYPFSVQGMPEQCGLPGYKVTCKYNNTDDAMLVLEISDKEYKVGDISYEDETINLINPDFMGDTCPHAFHNTTIDTSRFSYAAHDLNLTMHFNCSSHPPWLSDDNPGIRNISCKPWGNLTYHPYYCLPGDDTYRIADQLSRICHSTALIPFLREYQGQLGEKRVHHLEELRYGFDLNWASDATRWCKGCKDSGGICVRDLESPGKPSCACNNGSITNGTCSSSGKSKKTIIESVSAAVLGFLVVCLLLALYFYKHRKVSNAVIFWKKNLINNQKIEAFLEDYGSIIPRRYSYSNVKKITKAFQEKLGQGGYGTVFKGTLDNGHMVAVKILNDSKGDGEEFINEVASIGRTSHVNVVSLLGFCYEGSKRALVYDFMCNGSLDKLLNSGMPKTPLDWEKLYQIAIGIARGLEYLHRGCNARIVHFDIKPHNILLDKDFCPKISDFGLAKLCLNKESIISIAGARGTIGYIAPEVFSRNFGVVSSKSDVYSYGMMLLEITGGRKNPNEGVENSSEMYFPHWIYAQLHQNGDLSSCGVTAESEETVRKMVLVGLWCIQTMPENRPSMSQVIDMMEGSVDDLQIPPKPYLSSSPFGSIIGASSIQDTCWIDCIDSSVHS